LTYTDSATGCRRSEGVRSLRSGRGSRTVSRISSFSWMGSASHRVGHTRRLRARCHCAQLHNPDCDGAGSKHTGSHLGGRRCRRVAPGAHRLDDVAGVALCPMDLGWILSSKSKLIQCLRTLVQQVSRSSIAQSNMIQGVLGPKSIGWCKSNSRFSSDG
jgi:hypothetical protein